MANESTYGTISTLIGNIYEAALLTAREGGVVAPFVTTFSPRGDSEPRVWATYTGGTFASIDENTDGSAQAFHATVAGTATPSTYFQQVFLTDRRVRTDPMGAQQDASLHLGQTASETVDTALCALFSSLTGGTVGAAGGTATWANIFRAQAYIRTQKAFGTYVCILHPVQWYYLTSATSGVPTLMQNTMIAESIIGAYYQASFGGIDFYVDANITSGTAAVGGMFQRQAMYLDMRNPFRIEPQRDASRAGGGWELNATMEYAAGVYRPKFGVQIIGTSA